MTAVFKKKILLAGIGSLLIPSFLSWSAPYTQGLVLMQEIKTTHETSCRYYGQAYVTNPFTGQGKQEASTATFKLSTNKAYSSATQGPQYSAEDFEWALQPLRCDLNPKSWSSHESFGKHHPAQYDSRGFLIRTAWIEYKTVTFNVTGNLLSDDYNNPKISTTHTHRVGGGAQGSNPQLGFYYMSVFGNIGLK